MGLGDKIKQVGEKMTGRHHTTDTTNTANTGAYETGVPGTTYNEAGLGSGTGVGSAANTGAYETSVPGTTYNERADVGSGATYETETVARGQEAVCDQEYYTKTEDRPIVKEHVEYIKEHRPVEKEFVVETRATGVERSLPGEVEHMGTQEKIIAAAQPRSPCE